MTLAPTLVLAALLLGPFAAAADDRPLIADALPRIGHRGGPFLRHPRVVTVTFAGDDARLVAQLARFGDVITRTPWWQTVTAGYCAANGDCIGAGRPGAHVVLGESLPTSVHGNAIAALLEQAATTDALDGPLDDETLLLVYLPPGVALSDAFVPQYCGNGPRAFHRALRLQTRTLPYAVVPRCGDEAALTATASHEILEAATNPDPSRRGFAFTGGAATAGFTAAGVEPVDPCGLLTRNTHQTTASGFVVQRAWSNHAAARGTDPCVPLPNDRPYLALVPDRPTVRLRETGARVVVTLTAAASQHADPWSVTAVDLTGEEDGRATVDLSLDRTRVSAGDVLTLTLTALRVPPGGRSIVGIVSRSAGATFLWPIAVVLR